MAMQCVDREFVPVMLGGDINTYSVARAFYEEYGVRSYVFGKYPTGPSYQSKFITYEANVQIDREDYFIERINRFASEQVDMAQSDRAGVSQGEPIKKKVLLIGCGDSYVALASKLRNKLADNIIVPYIDFQLMDQLQHKELFYGLCEKYGLGYPGTIIHREEMGLDFQCDFSFPVIVKPSNSIMYWEHPFPGQDKVFKAKDRAEMESILSKIYGAGYKEAVIIQDMIPGNDEYMRVLTAYSDRSGKVKMMCLGHVLLEEHTPHGSGNHAIIIPEYDEELMAKTKAMLENLNYTGFSNFDIKYDRRDGTYRFFEINTRQGRSNFYVTNAGFNVAKLLVEDYIYEKEIPYSDKFEDRLWLTVPKGVARKYVKEPENLKHLNRLIREDKYVNPVFKKGDNNVIRTLRMLKTHFKQYSNYRTYYK